MCNYMIICCPEIENLANGDCFTPPWVIGNSKTKLCLLLVTKSKNRHISKKKLSSFKFKQKNFVTERLIKGTLSLKFHVFHLLFCTHELFCRI